MLIEKQLFIYHATLLTKKLLLELVAKKNIAVNYLSGPTETSRWGAVVLHNSSP